VPYHQRLDDGVPKFVNNDHCLLSARATLRLTSQVPQELKALPLAQTVWYIPTGLDPWNQLVGKMPGHYVRLYEIEVDPNNPPMPSVHWPDQEPVRTDGSLDERLNHWLTLVQRGEVLEQYRVFLGLMEEPESRPAAIAHLAFAGLIDVQDRMLFNRSYTTGHKSYRARATIELGQAIGWDQAHQVLYAGVPDIAVGPRWYSLFEMACNVCATFLDGRDAELLAQRKPLTRREEAETVEVLLESREPVWTQHLVERLKQGKDPRRLLDTIQVASSQVVLDTGHPNNYSMAQHSFEYCNTLGWFWDTFEHKHKLKLLFVAGGFVNAAAHHQRSTPDNGRVNYRTPRGASGWSQQELLDRIDAAMVALDDHLAVSLSQAYLNAGYEREPLLAVQVGAASKMGNDPHNQELGLCFVEDYRKSQAWDRDRLLLAGAKHTAGHRKYGDPLEAYRRYGESFGVETRGSAQGTGEEWEQLLDD
jgi:hypothetical protein